MPDHERADDVEPLAEPEIRGHDVLRQLVGDDRGQGDRPERQPLHPGGGERASHAGKRSQGVRRRADANLELSERLVHPPSALRLQSMQREAQGFASRRSTGISRPQFVHVPYVPSSIRFSAASISEMTCSALSPSV